MNLTKDEIHESPDYLRMSLAAAMTLDFKPGLFYRNAKLYCINLLLTYEQGCAAKCAYCGLSNKRPGSYSQKSFIRVTWPTYHLDEIIERISERRKKVKRICISMITNRRSVGDTEKVCTHLRNSFDIPVSVLVSPTLITRKDLVAFKSAGADKVGVAIDLATRDLFDQFRGSGVGGPHRWDQYWNCLSDAIDVFGKGNGGPHFMVGMGETEKEMIDVIQKSKDMGGTTHLFSFFPEANSVLDNNPSPPMAQYRRIQLGRYLIDNRITNSSRFLFDDKGRITDFGVSKKELNGIIDSGEPFRTSGCTGYDGEVACNRPFANSRPGPEMRNYPFLPNRDDVLRIRKQFEGL